MGSFEDKDKQFGKGNSFKVPEGYFEHLTERTMNMLPEMEIPEAKKVSLFQRVQPWLYMAAMFAGLIFFIKILVGGDVVSKSAATDSTLIAASGVNVVDFQDQQSEEDVYIQYIEESYGGAVLNTGINFFE
ncbi:MAG: hypothetical protein ACRCT5_13370 [Tannerellaceae bacterium]